MNAPKLAGIGAALAVAGIGLLVSGVWVADRDTPPAGVILNHSTGLPPIEDTVASLRQRVEDRPSDYLTRTELAGALLTMGHERGDHAIFPEAESVARAALDLNSRHQPARLQLARSVAALHRFDESRELARAVLAEDPSSTEAVAVLAAANLQLGYLDEAKAGYERLAVVDRSAAVVSGLAQVAQAQGDRDKAVALAEEALRLSRHEVRRPHAAAFYHYQLGHFRFLNSDIEGAIAALERALDLDADHPGATEEMAFIQSLRGVDR